MSTRPAGAVREAWDVNTRLLPYCVPPLARIMEGPGRQYSSRPRAVRGAGDF